METTTSDNKQFERLTSDFRRMSFVYGISIISLALVLTAMVWSVPSFDLFPPAHTTTPTPDAFSVTNTTPLPTGTTSSEHP